MYNNYIVLLVALVCAVLLLSVPMKCPGLCGNNVEGFRTYYGYFKQYCPSCGQRSKESCMSCLNCGLCYKNGRAECQPGSSEGPWSSSDCDKWVYGDTNVFYPNSSVYPVALTKKFWPMARPSVKKPYRWNKLPMHPVQ